MNKVIFRAEKFVNKKIRIEGKLRYQKSYTYEHWYQYGTHPEGCMNRPAIQKNLQIAREKSGWRGARYFPEAEDAAAHLKALKQGLTIWHHGVTCRKLVRSK
jgi:hypothetical protein